MTTRRMCLGIAAVVLGGCTCPGDRVTDTAYASTASHGPQIAACMDHRSCEQLCADVFQLGHDVEIERCEITSQDREAPATRNVPVVAPAGELTLLRGVQLRVVYVDQVSCDFGWLDVGASDDGAVDDGWTDDGSTDDGSDDDGSDDGSTDDGDDGDDGNDTGDDGSDDGGGDDGGGGDGGGGDGWNGGAHVIRVAPGTQMSPQPSRAR